jgi:CubicO group peptidase (beta-lactamase class C family)
MYNGTLDPTLAAQTFRNIERLFPSRIVARSHQTTPLPSGPPLTTPVVCSARATLDDYVRLNRVSALLVLKRGAVVMERYALGTTPRTRWMSMSIAKSITSTLIGIAIADGTIGGLGSVSALSPKFPVSALSPKFPK